MIIKYNLADKRYYLRDLGDGSGTFMKIQKPLPLKNGYIISFGDSHMTVKFDATSHSNQRVNDSI